MKRNKLTVLFAAAAVSAAMAAGCGKQGTETAETAAVITEAAEEAAGAGAEAAEENKEAEKEADTDQEAADKVAALIDAIYVQQRTDDTDAQCAEAKAAWDALTYAQKELVEGEEADPDYFGRDTGDASKDDPRNQDEIGENELLVVSVFNSLYISNTAVIKGCAEANYQKFIFPDFILIARVILRCVSCISSEIIRVCEKSFYSTDYH